MAGRASMPEGVDRECDQVSHPFASVISASHRPGQRPEHCPCPGPVEVPGSRGRCVVRCLPTVSTTATPSQAPQPESMESCGSSGEGSEIVKASTVSQPT